MAAYFMSLGSEKILESLQSGKHARMRDCRVLLAHWHRMGVGNMMVYVTAAAGPAQRRGSQRCLSHPPEERSARQRSNAGQFHLGPVVSFIGRLNFFFMLSVANLNGLGHYCIDLKPLALKNQMRNLFN